MRISVVVNNFNYERYLAEAIDSALAQTHADTEVIVVDDGSTDASRQIIASYGPRVRAICKENGGQGSTFNAGFAASTGEVIIYLDADDRLLPHCAERVARAWRPGTVKLHYLLERIDAQGQSLGINPPRDEPLARGDVSHELLSRGCYATPVTSGNALSRELLEQILPMPTAPWRICADGYLATLAPLYGPLQALDEPLGIYRIHGANAWSSTNTEGAAARCRKKVCHDIKLLDLLRRHAPKVGRRVTGDPLMRSHLHLIHRLGSLVLDPDQHPLPHDTRQRLAWRNIAALWRRAPIPVRRRALLSVLLLLIGHLPHHAAASLMQWKMVPDSKPNRLAQVRALLRPQTSRGELGVAD